MADLRIRDPFVLTDIPNARYVIVASIGNRQRGVKGWECYTSKDLRRGSAVRVSLERSQRTICYEQLRAAFGTFRTEGPKQVELAAVGLDRHVTQPEHRMPAERLSSGKNDCCGITI